MCSCEAYCEAKKLFCECVLINIISMYRIRTYIIVTVVLHSTIELTHLFCTFNMIKVQKTLLLFE